MTPKAQTISPIFITAPTARNGVTLLQRLLNSSGRCVVYGENVTLTCTLPQICQSESDTHRRLGEALRASRERFLREGPEYWSSDLWPDHERFMLLMFGSFFRAIEHYEEQAAADGFERWGIKNPMRSPEMIQRLRVLLPRARFLFIHRDPIETARSAKARRFVRDAEDVREWARQWLTHTETVLADRRPDTLVVPYAALLADPENWIARLERFAGVAGIDRRVLETKINSFDGYIEPAALTPEEERIVRAETAALTDRVGERSAAA